jgi:hypothetical protein
MVNIHTRGVSGMFRFRGGCTTSLPSWRTTEEQLLLPFCCLKNIMARVHNGTRVPGWTTGTAREYAWPRVGRAARIGRPVPYACDVEIDVENAVEKTRCIRCRGLL